MHASRYFSISPTERDQIFYDWWRALGAKDFDNATPVTGDDRPITDEELLKSLQYLRFEPDPRLFDAVTVSAHDFLTRLFDRQAG